MTDTSMEDTRSIYYVQPWRRFFAKSIDYSLFTFAIALLSGFTYFLIFPQHLPTTYFGGLIFGFGVSVLSLPIEAAFICLIGTTPGKFLMATKISNDGGQKIGFIRALQRSAMSFLIGVGAGVPIIALIAMGAGYNQLQEDGVTLWDKVSNSYVIHNEMNKLRWILGVSIFAGFLVFNSLALYAGIS